MPRHRRTPSYPWTGERARLGQHTLEAAARSPRDHRANQNLAQTVRALEPSIQGMSGLILRLTITQLTSLVSYGCRLLPDTALRSDLQSNRRPLCENRI
jgi:hypothetical protein